MVLFSTSSGSPPMTEAVRRAVALYAQPSDWSRIRRHAMGQALGWQVAAGQYLALYQQAIDDVSRGSA